MKIIKIDKSHFSLMNHVPDFFASTSAFFISSAAKGVSDFIVGCSTFTTDDESSAEVVLFWVEVARNQNQLGRVCVLSYL